MEDFETKSMGRKLAINLDLHMKKVPKLWQNMKTEQEGKKIFQGCKDVCVCVCVWVYKTRSTTWFGVTTEDERLEKY